MGVTCGSPIGFLKGMVDFMKDQFRGDLSELVSERSEIDCEGFYGDLSELDLVLNESNMQQDTSDGQVVELTKNFVDGRVQYKVEVLDAMGGDVISVSSQVFPNIDFAVKAFNKKVG